jgi:hypothetical protein
LTADGKDITLPLEVRQAMSALVRALNSRSVVHGSVASLTWTDVKEPIVIEDSP